MLMSREKKHVGVGAEEAVTLVVGTEAAAAVILGDGKWYKTHHDVIIDLNDSSTDIKIGGRDTILEQIIYQPRI
jgi:type IV secretory pathway TrbD component